MKFRTFGVRIREPLAGIGRALFASSICVLVLALPACSSASNDTPPELDELPSQEPKVQAGDVTLYVRIAGDPRAGNVLIPANLSTLADLFPAYFSDPRFEGPDELKNPYYSPTVEQLTWSALGDFDFTAEVAMLDQRVLVLWGADDPFGLSTAEAVVGALSAGEVELVVLEKCGHFWHECPDAFFSSVRTFLELPPAP